MYPQYNSNYWYNTTTPDRLKCIEREFDFATTLCCVKYRHINSMVYAKTKEKGKVYIFENEYNLYVGTHRVKLILRETFHSYSMMSLDHPDIRGISFIDIKYEFGDMEDDCKNIFINFSKLFDELVNGWVDSSQRKYDTEYYWENPSHHESDGTYPIPDDIANRRIHV
jgi:hypothetical protein